MRHLASVVILLALPPVFAVGWSQAVETRFGPLRVMRGTVDETVELSGKPVAGRAGPVTDHRLSIQNLWEAGPTDVALVSAWTGGNDVCAQSFLIAAVTSDGARATRPFGRCSVEVIEAEVLPDGVRLRLRAGDPRLDHILVTYSAGEVSEVAVPVADDPVPLPGGGSAVTRWSGAHAFEIVRDAGERQRFLTVMPREKLFELMDRMQVGGGAELKDGWLIAIGNMAHQGCGEMGGFAIEIESGRVEAAMFHTGGAPEVFGGHLGSLHSALDELARIGAPGCKEQ